MDTPVQFSIREILTISGDIASYLHDQTHKNHIPLEPATIHNSATISGSVSSATVDVNSTEFKSYYALPSSHAKITIDDHTTVDVTLDNGSEVNLMLKRIFDKLELPINTEIRWHINAYDTNSNLESSGPIGVCHDVPISIDGVEVKQHFFIVKYSNADLILGRPWERAVRACFINEDDESYTVRIKDPDGLREAHFCAVKAEHERNRPATQSTTRSSTRDDADFYNLKSLRDASDRNEAPLPQDKPPDIQSFTANIRSITYESFTLDPLNCLHQVFNRNQ
jgi:hypothetical protein